MPTPGQKALTRHLNELQTKSITKNKADSDTAQHTIRAPLAMRMQPLKNLTGTKCLIQSGRGSFEGFMALNKQADRVHGDVSLDTIRFYKNKSKKPDGREFVGVLCDHDLDQFQGARRLPGWEKEKKTEEPKAVADEKTISESKS